MSPGDTITDLTAIETMLKEMPTLSKGMITQPEETRMMLREIRMTSRALPTKSRETETLFQVMGIEFLGETIWCLERGILLTTFRVSR